AAAFDIKQGEGGLVDLEFLLQALVLDRAATDPALLQPRNTPALIEALHQGAIFDAGTAAALQSAHVTLLARGLECTLDRRARRVPPDATVEQAREAIRQAARAHGLVFADTAAT
ncbi:MAG TPA: glutamine-synthetase adenylyltransferase, partial [Lysobacter sp.]|nr:glutamine-synthetase adenylyltransferase [Lysobacter sp.]